MSRIGKKQIEIPSGVTVQITDERIAVKGPKGELSVAAYPGIEVKVEENNIVVNCSDESSRQLKAMYGTIRSLVYNMVFGVSSGFKKDMQIFGTGYNIKEEGGKLVLNVGYCHPIVMTIPKSVTVEIRTPATRGNDVPAVFSLSSYDKQVLGQFAAEVRSHRPPEPYKGKGIRYTNEVVRRKVGKAFGA